jgi:hypothetical protein
VTEEREGMATAATADWADPAREKRGGRGERAHRPVGRRAGRLDRLGQHAKKEEGRGEKKNSFPFYFLEFSNYFQTEF